MTGMHSQSQQAQNIVVTPQVRRFGSYPGGFQIINNSLYTTVWASDNPSMQSGQGTPISPGTSIVWIRDGDLYLITGNDATSTNVLLGNNQSLVTISYDVSGWQPNPVAVAAAVLNSGIIIVDNTTTVFANAAVIAAADSGLINVSRYNSLLIGLFSLTGTGHIEVRWYDATGVNGIAFQKSYVYDASSFNSLIEFPCLGAYVRIINNTTGNVGMNVYASNRMSDRIRTHTTNNNNNILDSVQNVPAASNGAQVFTNIWWGDVDILMVAAAGVARWYMSEVGNCFLIDGLLESPMTPALNNEALAGAAFNYKKMRVSCFGKQLALMPANNTGAILQMSCVVTPVYQ